MSNTLSKILQRFEPRRKDIIKYFTKKGFDSGKVSEYCASTGIPLYVVYQFCLDSGITTDDSDLNHILDYYGVKK